MKVFEWKDLEGGFRAVGAADVPDSSRDPALPHLHPEQPVQDPAMEKGWGRVRF